MALNVLSWTMMVGGGLSSLLGVIGLGERIFTNREASLTDGLAVYKETRGQETSIQELYTSLSDGETRFPVYIKGNVHCWKDDGQPLLGPLSGEKVCHYELFRNGKPAERSQLPLFLRDKSDPNVGIFLPWDKLYHTPTDHNITLFRSLPPPQFYGQIEELFLPHGVEMHAVGEAYKNGPRLELRPSPSRPRSLYVSHNDPLEVINFVDTAKAYQTVGITFSLLLGASLFGGGWYLRQKYVLNPKTQGSSGFSAPSAPSAPAVSASVDNLHHNE